MSNTYDFRAGYERLLAGVEELNRRILAELDKEIGAELKRAYIEFGNWQKERIKKVFDDAVSEFYASYPPKYYHRQGDTESNTGGLFDVLDIKLDDQGMVIANDPNYDELYDESRMHTDRHGGSLFDKVFVKGWHGGAESIDPAKAIIWGVHPDPGIPHYRTGYHFRKWGKRAERSKQKAPYVAISKELQSIEGTEIFDQFKVISQKYNDIAVEKVNSRIPDMMASIFR